MPGAAKLGFDRSLGRELGREANMWFETADF